MIVTSYVNPDLDGVACAIVYARYLTSEPALARFAGTFNTETTNVMSQLGLEGAAEASVSETPAGADDVVLVDCHHPLQLPRWVRPPAVSMIVDHHPDGDPAAFPHATIQNESVGAAATLIAEQVLTESGGNQGGSADISGRHCALLACAIASNTLEFAAPSTTDRDRLAYEKLIAATPVDLRLNEIITAMRGWRRELLSGSTAAVVARDVKVVDSPPGRVAVAQLEAAGASEILDRRDLREALTDLRNKQDCDFVVLSLVDTDRGTTTLVVPDEKLRSVLLALAPTTVDGDTMLLDYIALRKTHLIPTLRG